MKQLTVYMADEIHNAIVQEAEKEGLSISKFMLKLYLNRSLVLSIESSVNSANSRLANTILARLDMLEKPQHVNSGNTITAEQKARFNQLIDDAVNDATKGMMAGLAAMVQQRFNKVKEAI